MRTIKTEGLACLGTDGIGPWRLGEDRLLRTCSMDELIRTLERAQQVYDSYRAAHDTGARTPAPIEVVRVDDGYGVVVEYVVGVGISLHLVLGSYGPEEAASEMGRLLRTLHAGRTHGGIDIKAKFVDLARVVAEPMGPEVGGRLVTLVENVPESDTLLHGDLHPGNVVVSNGELALIDMEAAGFGDPVFDLAISRSRTFTNALRVAGKIGMAPEQAIEFAERFWRAQLEGYLADDDAAPIEEIDRQARLLAQLDVAGFALGAFEAADKDQSSLPGRQLARELERLAAIVPEVSSLGMAQS